MLRRPLVAALLTLAACGGLAATSAGTDAGSEASTSVRACEALPLPACIDPCSGAPGTITCSDGGWTCPFTATGYACDSGSLPPIVCNAPLNARCDEDAGGRLDCPAPYARQISEAWCARNPGAGAVLGSCSGYDVLSVPGSAMDLDLFMYPEDGGPLSAVIEVSDGVLRCLGGAPAFVIPMSCFWAQVAPGQDSLLANFKGPGGAPGCLAFDGGTDGG